MSRSFSIIGLPQGFQSFQKEKGLRVINKTPEKEYFSDQGYSFKTYEDNEKNQYEEYECGCPWSSGPELYLGLKKKETGEVLFSWTQSQMGFSEDIKLSGYDKELKKISELFIKQENEKKVQGYCGLSVTILKSEVVLSQAQSKRDYEPLVYSVRLINQQDGPLLRDMLTQKGFSVEEVHFEQYG